MNLQPVVTNVFPVPSSPRLAYAKPIGYKSVHCLCCKQNRLPMSLVVEDGAQLTGDVYLFVTAGSTEWPVEVSIASSALVDDSEITSGNVPKGYAVELVNGTWTVVK